MLKTELQDRQEYARVLNVKLNVNQRCHLESWHIRLKKSKMNRDDGILPPEYHC